MKIYYKAREIDYDKTLGSLEVGQDVVIPSSSLDISNIRSQVSKVIKRLETPMTFQVNKTINGAKITRTE